MILKKITIENFRNHKKTKVEFNQNTTVFMGENGAGKTNLLEAIYALTILKPFRNIKKNVFIKENENFSKIQAILDSDLNPFSGKEEILEIFWEIAPRNRTIFKKNGTQISTTEFLKNKNFYAVLFAPEDLNLPFSSPRERRKFLSRAISPISSEFFLASINLEKILKQRNKLLQNYAAGRAEKKEFNYWDEEFIKQSELVTQKRKELIEFLNPKLAKYFQNISNNKDLLELKFQPSSTKITKDLHKNFQRDVALGLTSIGAHRDDFIVNLRNKPIVETGSRGEIRSGILSLKLAKRDFFKTQTGLEPLMLFDDVLSELDENHRKHFFETLENCQSIATTTDIFKGDIIKKPFMIYKVKNGNVFLNEK